MALGVHKPALTPLRGRAESDDLFGQCAGCFLGRPSLSKRAPEPQPPVATVELAQRPGHEAVRGRSGQGRQPRSMCPVALPALE